MDSEPKSFWDVGFRWTARAQVWKCHEHQVWKCSPKERPINVFMMLPTRRITILTQRAEDLQIGAIWHGVLFFGF